MLGDAEAVIDGRVAAGGIKPGGGAHFRGGHARDGFEGFRRVPLFLDEGFPAREFGRVAALGDEGAVSRPSVRITWAMALTTATLVPG